MSATHGNAAHVPEVVARRLATLQRLQPPSPKRINAAAPEWYKYYAGYSDTFVGEIMQALPSDVGTLLDPWNGSGTTTTVATTQRIRSAGFDLNPAAVVVARARLLRSDVADSIPALTEDILTAALRSRRRAASADLLRLWFHEPSASFLRAIERRLYRLLVESDDDAGAVNGGQLAQVSALAAFFYMGLFKTIRPLVADFTGSNPTWIRQRVAPEERLFLPRRDLARRFRASMRSLTGMLASRDARFEEDGLSHVDQGSSLDLPLATNSIDAIISSPPYCTRLDYVVATLPELAVLGLQQGEIKALRNRMIGTPTMPDAATAPLGPADLGPSARRLLKRIAQHQSKASSGYYKNFYAHYLYNMQASLTELRRVARRSAPVILVVQDSYYKDVHIDLPLLLTEMGARLGWVPLAQYEFSVHSSRNYATINRHSRRYRSSTPACETVLTFIDQC